MPRAQRVPRVQRPSQPARSSSWAAKNLLRWGLLASIDSHWAENSISAFLLRGHHLGEAYRELPTGRSATPANAENIFDIATGIYYSQQTFPTNWRQIVPHKRGVAVETHRACERFYLFNSSLKGGAMRGWGVTMLVLGIGSFILPMMGYQFVLMDLFGDYTPIAGIGLAVVGGILVGVSFIMPPAAAEPTDAE